MEVLVLLDFEATMGDELTVHVGDIVKNVSKAKEDGWLDGELRGKKGIFPANFVKEVPVYLIGDTKREPRSLRKTKKSNAHLRKCEVVFAYSPVHEDELELVVGETVEVLREIEDGWWMGKKNSQIGAFPSNFVREIFVPSIDCKVNDAKARPKLSDAVFSKEGKIQRPSLRRKAPHVKECCQVMFDYAAVAEDELNLKKGDVITILNKSSEDEGWWEGELNGRKGFFPDNFVMVIPADVLHSGNAGQPPSRSASEKRAAENQIPVMDQSNSKTEMKSEKPEPKDFRTDTPGKIKLPGLHKPPVPPPPVKEKPIKLVPKNAEEPQAVTMKLPAVSPVQKEVKEKQDQFDGLDVATEKLSHPTANRAKPPQRRPPSAINTTSQTPDGTPEEKDRLPTPAVPKASDAQSAPSTNSLTKNPSPPKAQSQTKAGIKEESMSLSSVLSELRELRMSLDLLKAQHERDIQDLKEEMKDETEKRLRLQDEVEALRKKQ